MNPVRLLLVAGLSIVGISSAGCQPHLAPKPDEMSPAEQAMVAQRVDQMKMVAHGANKELAYKAAQYGQLYIYDLDTGVFAYKGYLAPGENFVLQPASSRAEINKQHVDLARETNAHDEYQLFFAPE